MKKISKETNIAFAIMYVMQGFAVLKYRPDIWYALFIMPVIYFTGVYLLNRKLKIYSRERKKRNKLILFDEGGHYHCEEDSEEDMFLRQYPLTTKECYDSDKIKMTTLDEPFMWKEATPQEAEQAKAAYEKWKANPPINH